jgi:hypothetical protein
MTEYQQTSTEAWRNWLGTLSWSADRKILHVIERLGGATDYDIEVATGLKHQTVSGNRRHLVEKGRVVDSGRRDLLPTRRRAIVWAIPEGGA